MWNNKGGVLLFIFILSLNEGWLEGRRMCYDVGCTCGAPFPANTIRCKGKNTRPDFLEIASNDLYNILDWRTTTIYRFIPETYAKFKSLEELDIRMVHGFDCTTLPRRSNFKIKTDCILESTSTTHFITNITTTRTTITTSASMVTSTTMTNAISTETQSRSTNTPIPEYTTNPRSTQDKTTPEPNTKPTTCSTTETTTFLPEPEPTPASTTSDTTMLTTPDYSTATTTTTQPIIDTTTEIVPSMTSMPHTTTYAPSHTSTTPISTTTALIEFPTMTSTTSSSATTIVETTDSYYTDLSQTSVIPTHAPLKSKTIVIIGISVLFVILLATVLSVLFYVYKKRQDPFYYGFFTKTYDTVREEIEMWDIEDLGITHESSV